MCGWIGQDNVYRKVVDSRKHKLRLMDAYGIDEDIVQELQSKGVPAIRIKEDDTGNVLEVSMATFMEHSVVRQFDGWQRFLSVKYFTVTKG